MLLLILGVFSLLSVLAVPIPYIDSQQEAQSLGSSDWHLYVVDYDKGGPCKGGDTSIDLDSGLNPHISYYHSLNMSLRYAKWSGSAWVRDTVDSDFYVGWYSSLALDDNDHPHISYYDNNNRDLRYARWSGTAWNVSTVDWTGNVGRSTSIAIDSSGNPHISYGDSSNQRVKYALWNGNTWTSTFPTPSSGAILDTSIAIDMNDNPHIAFNGLPVGWTIYTNWSGGKWNFKNVGQEYSEGCDASLVLDNEGRPHISYHDYRIETVMYARWEGYGWNITAVDKGCSNSIDLDTHGNPRIAYGGEMGIHYASWTGTDWDIEVADPSLVWGGHISLTLDINDVPHISYRDYVNRTVKYATKAELAPSPRSIALDIDPDTLNLKSKGRWITAYLSAENASVQDIDVSTILLQDALPPERWEYQGDVLMLKFNRQELIAMLEVGESVQIELTGKWEDGTAFEAYDSVRVINPGK